MVQQNRLRVDPRILDFDDAIAEGLDICVEFVGLLDDLIRDCRGDELADIRVAGLVYHMVMARNNRDIAIDAAQK